MSEASFLRHQDSPVDDLNRFLMLLRCLRGALDSSKTWIPFLKISASMPPVGRTLEAFWSTCVLGACLGVRLGVLCQI